MDDTLKLNRLDGKFVKEVERLAGQKLNDCYQCGKCTAGCPIAASVEYPPHRVMRMAQLGLKQRVLYCPTIWLCLSCVTCTARCPKGVDLTSVMNALRELAIKEGISHAQHSKIKLFEKLFLHSIKAHGRLYEMGTLARFNLLTFQPFQDAQLLLPLLQKGKLSFTPKNIHGKKEIEYIFKNSHVKES